MKKFLLIILFSVCSAAFGATLTGSVKYSIEDARIELQNNKPNPMYLLTAPIADKNFEQNKTYLLKGVTQLKDRTLAKFSDNTYAVNYKNDPNNVWYYDKEGVLINTEVRISTDYPYKSYKYDIDGQLVNMSLKVSAGETFIFNPLGQLIGHWVGKNCYNENGEIVMTREIWD